MKALSLSFTFIHAYKKEALLGLLLLFVFLGLLGRRDEFQHGTVDTVALVGGRIEALAFEDMTEMTITDLAADFGPGIPEMEIRFVFHVLRFSRIVEGRPSAAGIEFLIRSEKLGVATRAVVGSGSLLLEFIIDFAVGTLGSFLTKDAILFGCEDFLPLFLGSLDRFLGLLGSFFHDLDDGFFFVSSGLLVIGLDPGNGGDQGKSQGEGEDRFHHS